jgi:hypothetical protein
MQETDSQQFDQYFRETEKPGSSAATRNPELQAPRNKCGKQLADEEKIKNAVRQERKEPIPKPPHPTVRTKQKRKLRNPLAGSCKARIGEEEAESRYP